jgi:protein-S-isoprenylcysteine O-methyltransferase Ste14
MASQLATSADSAAARQPATGQFVEWCVRRRVQISVVMFAAIITADLFVIHSQPRDIFNPADAFAMGGIALVVAGLLIRAWAAGMLRKQKQLATTGPYAFVRHPLYFGSFLMMIGFGVLVRDPLTLWIVAGPLVWLYWQTIRSEEQRVAKYFAKDWAVYSAKVPQFIPYRLVRPSLGNWSLAQWLHNEEYQAWIGSVVALGALKVWQVFG